MALKNYTPSPSQQLAQALVTPTAPETSRQRRFPMFRQAMMQGGFLPWRQEGSNMRRLPPRAWMMKWSEYDR